MKPIKTGKTNGVLTLPGGTDENDLPVEHGYEANHQVITSTWELSDEERKQVAEGKCIELRVWGSNHPPVSLSVAASYV